MIILHLCCTMCIGMCACYITFDYFCHLTTLVGISGGKMNNSDNSKRPHLIPDFN